MNWVLISLVSGLISGVCWLVGDIFLVGFDADEQQYKDFLQSTKIKNTDMAVLMLPGSVKRLRFGALIANFSIPFMLLSIYSLYTLAEPSVWSAIAAFSLGIGFCVSPVAHVAFYYVGTLCKSLFEEFSKNKTANPSGKSLFEEYMFFLNITWAVAVGITFLGWIVYTILIFLGKTAFPPLFGLLTPLIISPVAGLLTSKLKLGSPYLNGAGLNIGLSIFFAASLIYYLIYVG
ncbi:MAG: hypothetical protein H6Q60_1566 [Oscillospiraceae bacterium]|nr:hypothetical protein [Oscillospiraceae bacterium]